MHAPREPLSCFKEDDIESDPPSLELVETNDHSEDTLVGDVDVLGKGDGPVTNIIVEADSQAQDFHNTPS